MSARAPVLCTWSEVAAWNCGLSTVSLELDLTASYARRSEPPYPLSIRQVEPATSIRAADPSQPTPNSCSIRPQSASRGRHPSFGHAARREKKRADNLRYVQPSSQWTGYIPPKPPQSGRGFLSGGSKKDGGSSYNSFYAAKMRRGKRNQGVSPRRAKNQAAPNPALPRSQAPRGRSHAWTPDLRNARS